MGSLYATDTSGVLLREIEKCVVRCRNCHQIKTGNDFNYNVDVQDILEEHQKKMELYEPSQRYRCII